MTDVKQLPRTQRYVLALLAFSVFINYIDRGNLSIAAPMLKDEMGLSASQLTPVPCTGPARQFRAFADDRRPDGFSY